MSTKPTTYMSSAQKRELNAVTRIDVFLNFLNFLYTNIKDQYAQLSMEDLCKKWSVPSITYTILRQHGHIKFIGDHVKSWRYTGPKPTEALAETIWERTKLYQRQSKQKRQMKEIPKNANGKPLIPINRTKIDLNEISNKIDNIIDNNSKIIFKQKSDTISKHLDFLNHLYDLNGHNIGSLVKISKKFNISNVVPYILKNHKYVFIDQNTKKLEWLADKPSISMVEQILKSVRNYNNNHLNKASKVNYSTIENKNENEELKNSNLNINNKLSEKDQKIKLAEMFTKLGKYDMAIELLS